MEFIISLFIKLVFITVKIKLILLFLFIGGGMFYGLKVWQGKALGCPEPIIQEIKHHHEDILPYHGLISSYGPSDYSSYDFNNVYSNTPSSYHSAVYDSPPPSAAANGDTSFSSGQSSSSSATLSGPSNAYLPPSRRYGTARGVNDQTSSMITDLMFRFLGVNTLECKKRFVCELEFRNPFVGYAMNYIG
jgi:hypothetical protein